MLGLRLGASKVSGWHDVNPLPHQEQAVFSGQRVKPLAPRHSQPACCAWDVARCKRRNPAAESYVDYVL